MFSITKCILVLLLAAAPGGANSEDDLQAKLRSTFLNTNQTLRNFPVENHLRYDAAGNPVTKSPSGHWTVSGEVLVEQLDLEPDKLEIRGHRAVLVFDPQKKRMEPKIWKEQRITIEIATGGKATLEQLKFALGQVFFNSREETLAGLPDYWRPYFASELSGTNACGTDSDAVDVSNESSTPGTVVRQGGIVTEGENRRHAFPLPTRVSKSMRVQGSLQLKAVIDTTGKVKNICILKPLGAGLDDNSVMAVRQWEYTPYKLNGKPVEIKTTINFSFR